jgi:Fe-S cluster biosynthesis and repair protein YggX
MKTFEYKIIEIEGNAENFTSELNELGKKGWQLVSQRTWKEYFGLIEFVGVFMRIKLE